MTDEGDTSLRNNALARQGSTNNHTSPQAPGSTCLDLTTPNQTDDIETAAAEFRRTYSTSSLADRARLRNINATFANNPRFRSRVNICLEQSRQDSPHFRFLDLPTEIRLLIASYALAADQPLSFAWDDPWGPEGVRVGRLENFEETVALSRVSRQLHAELLPLIWKVNVFSFDLSMTEEGGVELSDLYPTAELFTRRLSPSQLTKLSPHLVVGSFGNYEIMDEIIDEISFLALQLPAIQIKAVDFDWNILPPGSADYISTEKYLRIGEDWRWALQNYADTGTRRWRIFPWTDESEEERRKEALRLEGHHYAVAWIE